jgi:hypothetical protein
MNASFPVPANMMPDSVPVKKVAMGMINSKNLLSTGLMALSGWVTNMMLYSTVNTMPTKVTAKHPPMNTLRRIINSSSLYFSRGGFVFIYRIQTVVGVVPGVVVQRPGCRLSTSPALLRPRAINV